MTPPENLPESERPQVTARVLRLAPARGPGAEDPGLPLWPQGWYVVARSRDIARGRIQAGALAERAYVLFRTRGGRLVAFDAYCPHMGAHLRHGQVLGEELRCQLHHWRLDGEGLARGTGADCARVRVWPVRERFGLVFLYLSAGPEQAKVAEANETDASLPELPQPLDADAYRWTTGVPVRLNTDWHSMAVNGFDMLHLSAVHNRRLIEPARFAVIDGRRLELRYTSRVTGRSPSDLAMKWLSGDRIRVRQNCYGPLVVVESDLGYTRTAAILGLLNDGDGIRAFGAFGVERGPFAAPRLWLARWLYTAFLRRDFKVVEGMRLRVDVADEGVRTLSAFLRGLPRADT